MPYKIGKMKFYIHIITAFEYYRLHTIITAVRVNVKENNGCLFNVILILHKRRFNFIGVKYIMLNRVHIENLSSQAYAHVFSANFALDCVKNPCRAASPPADFCLVLDKIMLENPHTFLVKTGSDIFSKGAVIWIFLIL